MRGMPIFLLVSLLAQPDSCVNSKLLFMYIFRTCDHYILGSEHLWVDVGTGVPVRYFEPSFGFQVRRVAIKYRFNFDARTVCVSHRIRQNLLWL